MKYLLFLSLLILPVTASADYYSRAVFSDPTSLFSISAGVNDLSSCVDEWGVQLVSFEPFQTVDSNTVPTTQNNATFYFDQINMPSNFPVQQVVFTCPGGTTQNLEFDGGNTLFTFDAAAPASLLSGSDRLLYETLIVYGTVLLIFAGYTIALGLAVLVFNYGWRLIKDRSFTIGGFYVRDLPYKGYNRWRSKKWNMTEGIKRIERGDYNF